MATGSKFDSHTNCRIWKVLTGPTISLSLVLASQFPQAFRYRVSSVRVRVKVSGSPHNDPHRYLPIRTCNLMLSQRQALAWRADQNRLMPITGLLGHCCITRSSSSFFVQFVCAGSVLLSSGCHNHDTPYCTSGAQTLLIKAHRARLRRLSLFHLPPRSDLRTACLKVHLFSMYHG